MFVNLLLQVFMHPLSEEIYDYLHNTVLVNYMYET